MLMFKQGAAAAARTPGGVDQMLLNGVKARRAGKLTGADGERVGTEPMEFNRLHAD